MSNLLNCDACGVEESVEVMERDEKDGVCRYKKCRKCGQETIIKHIPMEVYEAQHSGRSSIEGGWTR